MSQLAVGYRTIVQSGREQRTDGLHKHLGLIDADNLRATGQQVARGGRGLELLVSLSPAPVCYVQGYDRDLSQYMDVVVVGRNLTLSTNAGGRVFLPAGTAQSRPASFAQSVAAWSTPAQGNWYETPIQASGTFTGVECRIEWVVTLFMPTAGAYVYVGLGRDGSPMWNVALWNCPAANYNTTLSGVLYDTPVAGVRRYAVFLNANGAVATLHNNPVQVLYATEQRA